MEILRLYCMVKGKKLCRSVRKVESPSVLFSSALLFLLLTFTPSISQAKECWCDWKHFRILIGPSWLETLESKIWVAWVGTIHVPPPSKLLEWWRPGSTLLLLCISFLCVSAGLNVHALPILFCFPILSSSYLTFQQHGTQTLHLFSRTLLSSLFFFLFMSTHSQSSLLGLPYFPDLIFKFAKAQSGFFSFLPQYPTLVDLKTIDMLMMFALVFHC